MASSAQAMFVFCLLLGSVISAEVKPSLISSVAVAKTGVPFRIFGLFPQDSKENYQLKINTTDSGVKINPSEATLNASSASFDAVVSACPREEPFSDMTAILYQTQTTPSTGDESSLELKIGLEDGAQLQKELHLVREGGKIKGLLRIKNVIFQAPIRNLECSFNSSAKMVDTQANLSRTVYRPEKPSTLSSQLQCNNHVCSLGDLLGRTELLLEVLFNDPISSLFALEFSCDADFGLQSCPSVLTAKDTLHPGVIFTVPPTVIAGDNITLKVSGVEVIQDCTIVLPNKQYYHLAGSVSGCTQSSQNITCHVNKSVEVPVHLDSSASKAEKSDFYLKCEKISTVQQRTVKVVVMSNVSSVDFGGFLRVLKPARFNVSVIVTNTGPSDLKDLQCIFSYPDDFGFKPNASCILNNETDSYACPIKIGTVAGRDASGKLGRVNHTVTFDNPPTAIWGVSSRFSCTCGGKSAQKTLKVNDTDLVVLGTPPVDTSMQNDGYFWTYAIVIVNLFVIALVVFVGMWWRNRAIAKTMEGRGGAGGGFTEMELFSEGGGRLPMSKAD